ncbi:hypothetical protein B0T19DRAFT_439083 [Cercophora scortea]|uniref:Rhodopsin domain-containing protein n=1 Tax=Cercophora scortea TaxID=314031 RepID=A0AAE0IXB1_9PEZI|nr:hypothetical protein B0T19DRAFT_439083 [Cercophora scortea]
MTTEPGHTKFNLTYPPLPYTGAANLTDPNGGEADVDTYDNSIIPGILFGILVPHIVCTLFILARTWSRLFLLRKWFLDDTLIILAWIFSTTVCIVYSIAAQTPNLHDTAPDEQDLYVMRTYIGLICYQLCLCLTKLSILAFYLRIFSSRPIERRLAWATVIAVLLYGIPLLFITIFQCHPASTGSSLSNDNPSKKCFTFIPLLISSASLHTATDAWLIMLIIPCIIRLDLPPRQKAALAGVLSLSIFVMAASLTRLQLSLRANVLPSASNSTQILGSSTLAFFVMTVLELDLALLCASAPTLRPVIARFWPRLGMGEPAFASPRLRQRHRWLPPPPSAGDLTSVVSYHGPYPWTRQPRNSESKTASMSNLPDINTMPMPPLAVLAHRTPTTLSLRSFMSSMAPRSRGQTIVGHGEDRAGLLQRDSDEICTADQDIHVLEASESQREKRRRSSVGFEGYYDQYISYDEEQDERNKRRTSRNMGTNIKVDTLTVRRHSGRRRSSVGRWGDSQESFVLGVNDPNSPSRLSPVSDSGLSGVTVYKPLSLGGMGVEGKGGEGGGEGGGERGGGKGEEEEGGKNAGGRES